MEPNRNIQRQRPGLQTRTDEVPHPSICAGNAYSQYLRTLVLGIHQLGERNPEVSAFIADLRANHLYPSERTEIRWEGLLNEIGNSRPCRRTGNNFASRLRGQDLILLALIRIAYPKISAA